MHTEARKQRTCRDPGTRYGAQDIDARIAQLAMSRDLIDGALGCDHEDFAECPEFQAQMDAAISTQPGNRLPSTSRDQFR